MTFACPCCGYKTLPARDGYELCPVCFWEDQPNLRPQDFSDANGQTLVEAQAYFLSGRLWERREFRDASGRNVAHQVLRPPAEGEEREPDWQPFEQ